MKRNKFISRMLLAGILLNNLSIISNAGILSSDERYETFIENNITVKDVLEEEKVDIKVEGNTLVNYVDYSNLFDSRNNNIRINQDNKEIFFENKNNNLDGDYTDSALYFRPILEVNKTYTIILNIIENTISGEQFFRVLDNYGDYMSASSLIITDNRAGIVKAKFTVKENNNGTFKIYLRNPNNQQNRGTIKIKNLMILDGDWTNKEIPGFFEGLQSGFEDQLITQEMIDNGLEKQENLGKYKVEYKVTGKNIFDENMDISISNKDWTKVSNGFTINTQNNYMSDWYYLNLKPNTQYVLSANTDAWIRLYYGHVRGHGQGENHIGSVHGGLPSRVFTTDNTGYITLRLTNETKLGESYIKDIQLEEGNISTEYEPYKESINTFYLNSPLLRNDTIEYINGQATHIHKYNQLMFDGSNDEKWSFHTGTNTHSVFIYEVDNIKRSPSVADEVSLQAYMLSDKFASKMFNSYIVNFEAIRSAKEYNWIMISIENSKLSSIDVNSFKDWLKSNPVKVAYKLENPIYESIKASSSIRLFEGATHISNNSNIPAIMEVTVDRAINRAVECTRLAKDNPTINNLSKARYWNNLLRESIKKDNLQEEIDNITALNDMELERKNITSNLDVYIKSENILMMSLNTNSITFEDFSGIEDMIKENAVQISINSSLPYQLNAYLPTEIQNSDKSNTMDKQILNIKENSESTYQTFSNTTDKVILKDNCPYGNDIIHGIDIKLKSGIAHQKDAYKTTIKFEAEQK